MCPVNLILRRTLPPSRIFTPWLESARCVKIIFARCQRTFRPVCANCLREKSSNERGTYDTVARHYLYVGDDSEINEFCFDCHSHIFSPRPYNSCSKCIEVVEHYGNRLAQSGDTPYESRNVVLIAFRQLIKPGIVDPLI